MQLYWQKLRALDLWLLAALTDVGVTVPWVFVLYRATGRPGWFAAVPGLWLSLLVYVAAALWEAGDRGETEAAARRRVWAVLAGLATAYLIAYGTMPVSLRTGLISWNPAAGFLPVVGYLWFLGARSVTDGLGPIILRDRLPYQFASAAFGALLLTPRGGMGYPGVRLGVTWGLILMLVASLLALYVARTRALKDDPAGRDDARGNQRLGPVIASLLVLMLLVSFFGSETAVRTVGGWLSVAAGGLRASLWLIVSKYVVLLTPLMEALFAVMAWLYARALPHMAARKPLQTPLTTEEWFQELERQRTTDYQAPVGTIMIVLAVAAACLLLYLLGRRRQRSRRDLDEELVSLGFWPNLLADLKNLFLGRRFAGAGGEDERERLDWNDPRMLFRRLQAWGAAQVRPRTQSETPAAYGGALGAARPAGARAAGTVVAVYNQARYGPVPPDGARVSEAAAAVAELEQEHTSETPG